MSSDKSSQKGNFILVLVAMVLGVLIGVMFASNHSRSSSQLYHKMDEVLGLVQSQYVDPVNVDSLSESLVGVMLSELDPHSTYLSVRETEQSTEFMRGTFEGVGIVLHREGDTTYVGQVIAGGPSDGSGLLPGDMIVTVDGETVSGVGMPSDSVVARLRGPRNSQVVLGLERHGKEFEQTIRRGVVDRKTVPYSGMLDDTTGYILLTSFATTSYEEFHTALVKLKGRGMRHLIFDLRGNGGGSLADAVGIAGDMLPAGSLILYSKGEHSHRRDVRATFGGAYTKGRVTVLIDETSASASEVVSGALQDNDRATIVGRRSFGKGLVQSDFKLKDGSSVLLTTARYYTPSGRCIQRPYDAGTEEYYRSYFEQLVEETYADSVVTTVNDSTPYYTVGGRTVYGGGGIIPDRVLPYRKDSSFIYYNQLQNTGLMNRVAFEYVRGNVEELLRRYADADAFYRSFEVPGRVVDDVVQRAEKAGVKRDGGSLMRQSRLIKNRIKAYIGMSLYGDGAFYRILLDEDDDLRQLRGK